MSSARSAAHLAVDALASFHAHRACLHAGRRAVNCVSLVLSIGVLALLAGCSDMPLATSVPEQPAPLPSFAIVTGDTATATTASAATSITVNKPAGVVEGDFLLAQITFLKGSDITVTVPAGWTLVPGRRDNRGTDIGSAIYRKFAGASEPASYTWGFSQSVSANGGIIAYKGVDPVNPIVASSGNGGDSGNLTALGVTAENNSRLVAFYSVKKRTPLSTPTGMTERYFLNPSGDERNSKAADQTVAAGATGNRVSTPGTSDKWVAQLVALRAAPTVTVNKVVVNDAVEEPEDDDGRFNLRVNGITQAANVGHGGTTGQVPVTPGTTVTVSELAGTDTDLGDYVTSIACNLDKGGADGTSHEFEIAAGENVTCTITNTRKATLTIEKVVDPDDDEGKFNLQVDGVTVSGGAAVGDGASVNVKLAPGEYTVGETGANGTDLDDYDVTIGGACDENGDITLTSGQTATCTITNTRKAPPPPAGTGLYLHNRSEPPSGNTTAMANLPLSTDAPTVETLYNYATNLDNNSGVTGRFIDKAPNSEEQTITDLQKYQTWRTGALAVDLVIDGTAELEIWAKMKASGKNLQLRGFLRDCNSDLTSCTTFATLNMNVVNSASSSAFQKYTLTAPGVSRTIAAGRVLQLRVVLRDISNADPAYLGYDTVDQPAKLFLP